MLIMGGGERGYRSHRVFFLAMVQINRFSEGGGRSGNSKKEEIFEGLFFNVQLRQ